MLQRPFNMLSSRVSLCSILRNTKSNGNARLCFKSSIANLPRVNEKGGGGGNDTSFSSSSPSGNAAHLVESYLERFQPASEKRYSSRVVVATNDGVAPISPTPTLQEFIDRVPLAVKERSEKDITPGEDHDPLMQLFRYVEKRSSSEN